MNPFRPNPNGPSIIEDANPRAYHSKGKAKRGDANFPMSRTELARFDANPWEWVRNAPVKQTGDMAWGSLIDCMLTTPQRTAEQYAIYPDKYPSEGKKGEIVEKDWNKNSNFCKAWEAERQAKGMDCVYADTYEGARQACASLHADPRISELITCSKTQVMVLVDYVDKDTGLVVPFRCLIDFMPDPSHWLYGKFLADLKSSFDIGISEWEKTVFYQGYHVQSALYVDVANAALGKEQYSGFLHVLSKSSEPYAVGRRVLSEEFLDLGCETYKRQLARYCRCLATNTWPGVDDDDDNNANPIVDGWRLTQPSAWMIR